MGAVFRGRASGTFSIMKIRSFLVLLVIVSAVVVPAARADDVPTDPYKAAADKIPLERDRLAVKAALVEFAEAPQLASFFENCFGCAVFPTVGKGGFVVGGSHGKGWVFKHHDVTGYSKVTQVTVGFQAGGQAFSQIIFFEDAAAYARFTSSDFEFGAQASAVALNAGANAATSTVGGSGAGAGNAQSKRDYTDGMAVFTKAKGGLMYEAAIGGQKFIFRPLK